MNGDDQERSGKLDIEGVVKRLVGQSVYVPPYGGFQLTVGDLFDQGSVVLVGHVLGSDGVLRRFGTTVDPPTRGLSSSLFPAPEGWVVNACVTNNAAVMSGSEMYARLEVLETVNSSAAVLGVVLAGYAQQGGELSFPSGVFRQGMVADLAGVSFGMSNPAAGADLSEGFTEMGAKILRGFSCRLVTDANVANRRVVAVVVDLFSGRWAFAAGSTQAASLTRDYTFTPATLDLGAVGTDIGGPFAELSLQGGWNMLTAVQNIQAGDQLSRCTVNGDFYLGSSV